MQPFFLHISDPRGVAVFGCEARQTWHGLSCAACVTSDIELKQTIDDKASNACWLSIQRLDVHETAHAPLDWAGHLSQAFCQFCVFAVVNRDHQQHGRISSEGFFESGRQIS